MQGIFVCKGNIVMICIYRGIKGQVIQDKLGMELCSVLQERPKEAFPGVRLSRDGLMKYPQNTLLACSLIALITRRPL